MKNSIKVINGNEIIDYLNELDSDELKDISCQKPYVFEAQEIRDGKKYRLTFSAYFNNWGTDQLIEGNYIEITENGVRVWFEEPFEGDGSSEALEELLTKWLETHEFSTDYEKDFDILISDVTNQLSTCQYGDSKILEDVLKKLTKAKTLIK